MLDTDEIKKNKVIGVELAPVETVDGQVKLGDKSASSVASLNRTPLLEKMLKAAPNFAAQQQKLNGQEPVIKNNPALGEYQLIDDLGGLMHGTYLQATNSESHAKDRSLVSRNSMSETASLVNYRAATDFSGYGHLKIIQKLPNQLKLSIRCLHLKESKERHKLYLMGRGLMNLTVLNTRMKREM